MTNSTKYLLLISFLIFPLIAWKVPNTIPAVSASAEKPFAAIDKYARSTPAIAERTVQTLAEYLSLKASTDLEKARAIYIWITLNINYDDVAFNTRRIPPYTPEYVLEYRKAVCGGFAILFHALGKKMGLDIIKVSGYSKGYGYRIGQRFTNADHAWNLIKIDGKPRVFDATWGGGYGKHINGKLVITKQFTDYWFNLDPYEAIFNHYPQNSRLTFVQPSLSLRQYERLPTVYKKYFEMGFDPKEVYTKLRSNPYLRFPKVYTFTTEVIAEKAPLFKVLQTNQTYHFKFRVSKGIKMALVDAHNTWTYFKKEEDHFLFTFTPKQKGDVNIVIQHSKNQFSVESVLLYTVE